MKLWCVKALPAEQEGRGIRKGQHHFVTIEVIVTVCGPSVEFAGAMPIPQSQEKRFTEGEL